MFFCPGEAAGLKHFQIDLLSCLLVERPADWRTFLESLFQAEPIFTWAFKDASCRDFLEWFEIWLMWKNFVLEGNLKSVTCKSLDSQDFFEISLLDLDLEPFSFHFHFSISISSYFYFTFTSWSQVIFFTKRVNGLFFTFHFSIVQKPLSLDTVLRWSCLPRSQLPNWETHNEIKKKWSCVPNSQPKWKCENGNEHVTKYLWHCNW